MYLAADASRQGFVGIEDIKTLCKKLHLPTYPELIEAVSL